MTMTITETITEHSPGGTIAERVAAGAKFLDEAEPGWDQLIDLGTLDLGSSCRCVLGQLWTEKDIDPTDEEPYEAAVADLDIYDSEIDLGFNSLDVEDFRALTSEWRHVIEARRAVAA